jgi:hypothetical protein
MDAVEYIKGAKRICKSRGVCKSVSSKCPLLDENGHCTATADICAADIIEKTENAVQIVEQWAKEHPVKTRQSEFLRMFPNAPKSGRVLDICPRDLNIEYMPPKRCENISCSACKTDYWLTEVTEND